MKKWLLLLALPALIIGGWLHYAFSQSTANRYTCTTTSVTSATVPTVVLSPQRITTWIMHVEASPVADPVKLFPYNGTAPTVVPSPEAALERPSGSDWMDQITCNAPNCMAAIGEGWEAYLEGGSTATKIDVCVR